MPGYHRQQVLWVLFAADLSHIVSMLLFNMQNVEDEADNAQTTTRCKFLWAFLRTLAYSHNNYTVHIYQILFQIHPWASSAVETLSASSPVLDSLTEA